MGYSGRVPETEIDFPEGTRFLKQNCDLRKAEEGTVSEHPTPEKIMQIGFGFWAAKTLLSAVEMAVFTELARGPEGLEELTGRLGLHPRSARDFLDTLVALGFLERREGKYSNAPDSDLFLDKKKPSYIGGVLEMV